MARLVALCVTEVVSGRVVFVCGFLLLDQLIMELFSLEDDGNDLFITQTPRVGNINKFGGENEELNTANNGDLSVVTAHYSDISDDEFVFPCSQKRSYNEMENYR